MFADQPDPSIPKRAEARRRGREPVGSNPLKDPVLGEQLRVPGRNDGLDVLGTGPARPKRVALIGGGARSAFWAKLIASVLDLSLIRYEASDRGPAYGAARLARLAVTNEDAARVVVPPPIRDVITPDAALCEAYRPRIEAFRTLYRALKPVWPSVTV